jgi:ABC-type enterochelin transport system permease subunit
MLFPSILCTCPNQHNLCSLIVSVMVGFFKQLHTFLYQLISPNILFHCHILGLQFFYTLAFQKCSITFYLSLVVSRFLTHMLTFHVLLCSIISILVFWICFYFWRKFATYNASQLPFYEPQIPLSSVSFTKLLQSMSIPTKVKPKEKFTVEQATKAQKRSRYIDLLFH